MRIISTFAVLAIVWAISTAQARADVDPLDRVLHRQDIPGVAFAIVQPGADGVPEVVVGGVGKKHIAEDAAPGGDTVFEVASLGKPVFAYLVMLLVQDGVLDLDRPLVDYMPEPWVEDERGRQITARMVLSHTSGLARRAQLPPYLAHDPGEEFLYSNNAYQYLQAVVEYLTGKSVDELAEERVFGPLGMSRTSFVWEERFDADMAVGHDEGRRPLTKWGPASPKVAYSLHTTAWDLGVFLSAVLYPESLGAPLEPDMVDLMLEPHTDVEYGKGRWSMGWGVRQIAQGTEIYHDGRSPGFDAYLWGLREGGIGIIALSNGSGSSRVVVEALLELVAAPGAR